eukprot:3915419-Rhodomonas_salina.1
MGGGGAGGGGACSMSYATSQASRAWPRASELPLLSARGRCGGGGEGRGEEGGGGGGGGDAC